MDIWIMLVEDGRLEEGSVRSVSGQDHQAHSN